LLSNFYSTQKYFDGILVILLSETSSIGKYRFRLKINPELNVVIVVRKA